MALHNALNRPMRTRMSGGVAGESGRPLPLCRFSGEWPGTRELLFSMAIETWDDAVGHRESDRKCRFRYPEKPNR